MFFQFEMQPDASIKKTVIMILWNKMTLNLQFVGNPHTVTLHVKLGIGIAKDAKLQNMFKMLCN